MSGVQEARPLDTFADERPKPPVTALCKVCATTRYNLWSGSDHSGVVSPSGIEHIGLEDGDTACGKDGTGENWWWPL